MSENTPKNNNENLDQEEQQGQTQGEEQGQNDQKPIQGEKVEPEDTPEEVKEEARKLGKGEPDAYYKISEEEYEKMKKHVPEDLQKTIASSKIKNGAAPQCWLPAINGLAFGLIAFVPGLNIAYGAVLLANLKILPMWPKKKVENSIGHNITGNKPERVENSPSTFGSKDNNQKQSFGSKDENNGKQHFGSKEEDNKKQSFGSKDNNNNSGKQSFGSKKENNGKQYFGSKDNNKKQSFGSKDNNQKQSFGSKKTDNSPNPPSEVGTKEGNAVNFGTADSSNSVLDSFKKVSQSFGTGGSSSFHTTRVEYPEKSRKTNKVPDIPR